MASWVIKRFHLVVTTKWQNPNFTIIACFFGWWSPSYRVIHLCYMYLNVDPSCYLLQLRSLNSMKLTEWFKHTLIHTHTLSKTASLWIWDAIYNESSQSHELYRKGQASALHIIEIHNTVWYSCQASGKGQRLIRAN